MICEQCKRDKITAEDYCIDDKTICPDCEMENNPNKVNNSKTIMKTKITILIVSLIAGVLFFMFLAGRASAFTGEYLPDRFPSNSSSSVGGMAVWKRCELGMISAEWCNLYNQVELLKRVVGLLEEIER